MGEKIAFGFIGILVLGAIALLFLINLYLGIFVLIFTIGVFWWIYGVRKRKVDSAMHQVSIETGLSFTRDPLKYGMLKGTYKGFETEIGVYTDTDVFGGAGVILTSLTGDAAFSTLEIRNFTGIKMKHNSEIKEKKVISDDFPVIVADKDEIYMMLPYVSVDPKEIKRNLNRLCKLATNL